MKCPNCNHKIDLHQHDAEVRKPLELRIKELVEALEQISTQTIEPRCAKVADAVLAQIKDTKDL